MAMSDTMSSPRTTDWVQFYQLNHGGQASPGTNTLAATADAAVVTTTITSSATPATSSGAAQLSPKGRVSKPARRRRACRAVPTTLLNTDTTNFRAMVQQFTGVPSAPFTYGTQITGPNLSFGLAPQSQNISGIVGMGLSVPALGNCYSSTNRYHHHQQQLTQQQQQQYYRQQQQSVFPFSNSGDGFQSSERFVMEGGPTTHQVFPGSSF